MCYVYNMTLIFHSLINYWVYDVTATVKCKQWTGKENLYLSFPAEVSREQLKL